MPLSKQDHLDPEKGPKRILALDGGGIRGILSLEYLKAIETLVKERMGQDALLCDYFDLIGGTSTGSIIAAGLACGMTVDSLQALYRNLAASAFVTGAAAKFLPGPLQGKLSPKFPAGPLLDALNDVLGPDTPLDSDKIRTGLMLMTKRLDSGAPWPLNNGGRGPYAAQDGALLLAQIVRASAAAPTYFAPELVTLHRRDGTPLEGAFVDGGVTPFNDPALQLLMLAALQGHGFRWRTGRDQLLIVSVGAGIFRQTQTAQAILSSAAAVQGLTALVSLMDDCERMNRAMLQWLTDCLTPWVIDSAVGDMKLDSRSGPQLATYVHYNVVLDKAWMKEALGLDVTAEDVEKFRRMDDPENLGPLAELGRLAASKQVKPEHLPAAFDLPEGQR